jgi:hypothetical protein
LLNERDAEMLFGSLSNKINLDMDYSIIYIYHLITIREDLDAITSILYQAFEIPSFKRDYDTAFGKIANILSRYGIIENPRNLRFRFTLCMQEFFDSIPQDQWKIKDPAFIKESEVFAITKFKEWIIEQIT